jgi:RNA polymerase sigma-70 factor (TIGR02960 family)
VPEAGCRTCGRPLPRRAGQRGRSSVYCSAACRQKAYRLRHTPATGEVVHALIADIERRVQGLTPQLPGAFYADVTALSTMVGRLRRIAHTARDAAQSAVASPGRRAGSETVTPADVTESPVVAGGGAGTSDRGGEVTAAAVRSGDEWAFAGLAEPYRRELQVHCYRLAGSYDDAEDLVQETFLRAWRSRAGFQGRATFRAWLYRIATNTCLDFLRRQARRPERYAPAAGMAPDGVAPPARIAWLQPFPDRLLEEMASQEAPPDAAVVSRETIELVFLTAIQHLPPRQRAVLILRDVLGWPAGETAATLELSVAAVNSALQRARTALRQHLPQRRSEWTAATAQAEQAILQRYLAAAERTDLAAMAALLSEDVRLTMPPNPMWCVGRGAIMALLAPVFDPASPHYLGRWRTVPVRANRQPAAASYVQRPGTTVYRAQVLDVLRIEGGQIVEITAFEPHLFPAFGLPLTL